MPINTDQNPAPYQSMPIDQAGLRNLLCDAEQELKASFWPKAFEGLGGGLFPCRSPDDIRWIPDSVAYDSATAYRQHADEILEDVADLGAYALLAMDAGCPLSAEIEAETICHRLQAEGLSIQGFWLFWHAIRELNERIREVGEDLARYWPLATSAESQAELLRQQSERLPCIASRLCAMRSAGIPEQAIIRTLFGDDALAGQRGDSAFASTPEGEL